MPPPTRMARQWMTMPSTRQRAPPRKLPPLERPSPSPYEEERPTKKKQKRKREDRVSPQQPDNTHRVVPVRNAPSIPAVSALSRDDAFRQKLNLEISRVIDILVPRYKQRAKKNFSLVAAYGSDVVATARALSIDFGGTFDDVPTFAVRHAYEFELRVYLRQVPFPNAIELLDGKRQDVLPGYLAVKLSDSLMQMEKNYIKGQFSYCFDADGYISTAKLVPWFNLLVAQAMRIVADRDEHRRKLTLVNSGAVNGRGFLVEIKTESDQIKIFIYPAIRGTGWPKGATIKDNIPHVAGPFETAATRYKREIAVRLSRGESFWHLEAKSAHIAHLLPLKFSPKMSGRHWSLNFTRYESLLFRDSRQALKQSASILLEALAEFHDQNWQSIIDDRMIVVLLLAVCKEDFLFDQRNCGELILKILTKFHKLLCKLCIPNYFMKNVNLLAPFEPDTVRRVASEFGAILSDIRHNPETIRNYFHPKFIEEETAAAAASSSTDDTPVGAAASASSQADAQSSAGHDAAL